MRQNARRALAAAWLVALIAAPRAATRERIVFDEEFSGPGLDRSKWNVIVTGGGWRTVNNEQQAYIDSTDVLEVSGGHLVIHPRLRPGVTPADGHTYDFVSARIDTRGKYEFTCGTAAARM